MRTSISTTSGRRARARVDGRAPVAGLADDLDARVARQHRAQAGAHQVVVVDEQDADGVAHAVSRRRVRQAGVDAERAVAGGRLERPAEQRGALAHPEDPVAAVRSRAGAPRRPGW